MRNHLPQSRFLFWMLAILILIGCTPSFHPRPLEKVNFMQRAQTQTHGNLRVTAAVLGAEETLQVFGFPLYKKGVQPVWLQVENNEKEPTWFLPVGLDPDYFSPLEVTYPYHRAFKPTYNRQIDTYFMQQAMGMYIAPGTARSGFVFTNLDLGTKIFNVDLVGDDNDPKTFTFFIPVPGLIADHQTVEFEKLYSDDQLVSYDEAGLKAALEKIPCCTEIEDGTEEFVPINLVVVGDGDDLLRALIRGGWNETASVRSASQQQLSSDIPQGFRYKPVIPLYYYGRPQDASFRGTRSLGFGQAVLRLWLAPIRYGDQAVWVGLINRDLFSHGRSTAHNKVDLDQDRSFFLQNLWYAQGVTKYGFVKGGAISSFARPRKVSADLYYLSDGFRLVLWIAQKSTPFDEVVALDWEYPPQR